MKKKIVKLWVDEDFARVCKANASMNNQTIINYTEQLSKNLNDLLRRKMRKLKRNTMEKNEKIKEKYKFSF